MIPPISLEIFVVLLGIILLMVDAFLPNLPKRVLGQLSIFGLLIAFVASFFLAGIPGGFQPAGFYVLDGFGLFFKQFMLISTALTILAAIDYAPYYRRYLPASKNGEGLGEYFILPLFTCAGLMLLSTSADFIMIFVALELVTIAFYVQVASMRKHKAGLEAGVKYLILGALSTGFLVYGITWIFGMTGQTSFAGIAQILPQLAPQGQTGLLFGLALVLVALGFKVAAFPFQFWVPDVYQGAPTPTTVFLSVASKAAGFVVLIRVVQLFMGVPELGDKVILVVSVLAGATLLYGNLAAMPQTNFKRLLAYSSIAHAGYLLLGVASISSSGNAEAAITFYLAGYLIMTFSAFLVLILVGGKSGADEISDLNGLSKRSPFLAFALLLSLVSLAGIPFPVGFMGKFLIFESAIRSEQYVLVGIGVLAVACGFYYYFKAIRAAYWQPAVENLPEIQVPIATRIAITILSAAIIGFGIFPQPILNLLYSTPLR